MQQVPSSLHDVPPDDTEDDDMADIVAKEAWLASLGTRLRDDPPEPGEAWVDWRTAA
jgi:hypothetical protein